MFRPNRVIAMSNKETKCFNIQDSYSRKTKGKIGIMIIIITRHELGVNRHVSASSNNLFKGLTSTHLSNYCNITPFKARLIYIIYKDSVRTSQRTQCASNTKTNLLLLYRTGEYKLFILNTQKYVLWSTSSLYS